MNNASNIIPSDAPCMVVANRSGDLVNCTVGMRVRPVGYTKDGLTYGYVRDIVDCRAVIYWPEIKALGRGWKASDFVVLGRACA